MAALYHVCDKPGFAGARANVKIARFESKSHLVRHCSADLLAIISSDWKCVTWYGCWWNNNPATFPYIAYVFQILLAPTSWMGHAGEKSLPDRWFLHSAPQWTTPRRDLREYEFINTHFFLKMDAVLHIYKNTDLCEWKTKCTDCSRPESFTIIAF